MLSATERADLPPEKPQERTRRRALAAANANERHDQLTQALAQLDAAPLPAVDSGTDGHIATITAARNTLLRSAQRFAEIYAAAIGKLFETGQYAQAAQHAAKALELIADRDEAGNVVRVVQREPRAAERTPPTLPTLNVGFMIGGTRRTEVPPVPEAPQLPSPAPVVIDAAPEGEPAA